MKIIVDILGGDLPKNNIDGAVLALHENKSLNLILVGDKNYAEPLIEAAGFANRVDFLHTTENISPDEVPTAAIKKKTGSSIVMGFDLLRKDEGCSGFVSAGSTGALLAGAFVKIGRIEGVSRPTLCPRLPTKQRGIKTILADAGANVDCKPINLAHFALMSDVYARLAFGVAKPRIGLVNIGTEENKGNELTAQVYGILAKLSEKGVINFAGNMEARDALSGKYDILIADGFAGNVLLKAAEGALSLMGSKVSQICHQGFWGRLGGLMLARKLKKMKTELNEESTGGSIFLGLKKIVVKAHGNSSPVAFKNAILATAQAANVKLESEITKVIAENKQLIESLTGDERK